MKTIDEQEDAMYEQGLDFCFTCRGWFPYDTLCQNKFDCSRYWLNIDPKFFIDKQPKETK